MKKAIPIIFCFLAIAITGCCKPEPLPTPVEPPPYNELDNGYYIDHVKTADNDYADCSKFHRTPLRVGANTISRICLGADNRLYLD